MTIDDVLGQREVQAVRWADFLEYEFSEVATGDLHSELERQDAEFVRFHALLRQFRGVRCAGGAVQTLRGLRVQRFTARCPVSPLHVLTVTQVVGGAAVHCERCAASEAKMARLGAWMRKAAERVRG
jgi:hypothetical protein